ncbi:MAG: glucose 1-dehydrogenase [Sedimentisphaerales bacterium]|nr:glucose 1-dehydrogenase [Sedimentisphaerales bacterium]
MMLKDKVAIVTGSSKGIGEGIARVFVREGAKVVVTCRTEAMGEKMAEELGAAEGKAIFVKADLTKDEDIQALVAAALKAFGKLDILVNNAGYHISKNAEDTTLEEWEFIQNTNLRSTFLCSKYSLPALKKTKGNIINISSMVGVVGQPNAAAYSATKGGQIAMTKNMAIDYAPDGVRVNVICPGWIQTPLVEDWFGQQSDPAAARKYIYGQHPLGRIGTIEECGDLAAFIASDKALFITGARFDIDGGVTLGY